MRAAALSVAELKAAGYGLAELKGAGFGAAEMKAAEYSAAELKEAGYTPAEMKAAGYSAAELTAATLIALGAEARTESRGVHYRTDHPERSESWRAHLIQTPVWGMDGVGSVRLTKEAVLETVSRS